MMEKLTTGNRICRRTYILIVGELSAPLLVGSGEEEESDRDVILDERGKPFLPGSALAGALRRYLVETSGTEAANYIFGGPVKGDEGSSSTKIEFQSRLWVYDMELEGAKLGRREGVRLNEFKTAVEEAKYTVQVVERGAGYRMRLELVEREDDLAAKDDTSGAGDGLDQIRILLAGLCRGEITLGAKSRRGFGSLSVRDICLKQFDITQKEAQLAWLDWDWEHPDAFDGTERWDPKQLGESTQELRHCLCVPLKVKHTLMIRKYSANDCPEGIMPDYMQLKSGEKAVIPGTGWLGAIRSRLAALLIQELGIAKDWEAAQKRLEPILGSWSSEGGGLASAVRVAESVLEGGQALLVTRNAIDRFTGGTVRGALYSGEPWVSGRTELVLSWPRRLPEGLSSEAICGLLLWVIADLQNGLLAVGGETAVGRGIFEQDGALKLNGEALKDYKPYYKAAVDWCQSVGQPGQED